MPRIIGYAASPLGGFVHTMKLFSKTGRQTTPMEGRCNAPRLMTLFSAARRDAIPSIYLRHGRDEPTNPLFRPRFGNFAGDISEEGYFRDRFSRDAATTRDTIYIGLEQKFVAFFSSKISIF